MEEEKEILQNPHLQKEEVMRRALPPLQQSADPPLNPLEHHREKFRI